MKKLSILCLSFFIAINAFAAEADPFGWLWVDYGAGSRYSEGSGRDAAGTAQANIGLNGTHGGFSARVLAGGTLFSNDRPSTINLDPNNTNTSISTGANSATINDVGTVRIREAYIMYDRIAGSNFGLTVGLQPIWFGLKPGGYEADGDRNVQSALEFGGLNSGDGTNSVNIAGQVTTGVRLFYNLDDIAIFAFGIFDNNGENTAFNDGSSLYDNYYATLKFNELFISGLYLFVGYEGIYVGSVDGTKPIFDTGIGYQFRNWFDLSFEYIYIHSNIAGLATSENYYVTKLTIWPTERLSTIIDWTQADDLNAYTTRFGFNYRYNESVTAMLQWAVDKETISTLGTQGERRLSSVDARVAYSF